MHADAIPASRLVGNAIRRAGEMGALTDSIVNPLTTTTGLESAVTAAVTHADQQPILSRINKAIDIGIADATLTNTTVAAADTVAGLAALTQYDTSRTYGSVD